MRVPIDAMLRHIEEQAAKTRNRKWGSMSTGNLFSEEDINNVWRLGIAHPFADKDEVRFDACGALIARSHYGQDTDYGWEIDHILPVKHGGTDNLVNLQPLHRKNNRQKADNFTDRWAQMLMTRLWPRG